VGEYLLKIFNQIKEFTGTLSPGKKAAMLFVGTCIIGGLVGLFFWASHSTYVPLMTNLNPEDSTNIIRLLREKHIPFRVDPTGKNILVPPENLYEFRLELATMGLPQSSVIGYEIFDKQSFGTTTFVQKLNQKRALEGELIRTINTIKGVKRSRVHLALPQKTAFVEDQKKATASVVVDLEPGTVLADKQVYGIGNLVSRAVEGLEVSDVVVMNSDGKVLSRNPSDPLAAATATQLEYQQKVEADLEKRVEAVLSRVVGEGHVVAKVTADLDFSQINETQTVYDSDGSAVVSVEKHNDAMSGTRPGPYGVSGNASNAPGQPPSANGEVKTETSKNNEVTNYKVPETVRRTTRSTGSIKRISVAVVIDGKRLKTTDQDGKVVAKVENWTPEKLQEFEQVASTAVGLDRKRGDTFEIKSMEFTLEDFDEAQRAIAEAEKKSYISNLVTYGVIGLAILLFFLFVVRPFIKWITENTIDTVDTFLPQTIEELEKIQRSSTLPNLEESIPLIPENMDPVKVEGEMIKEKIITLVDANPHKAALILKDWLHGHGEGKKRAESDEKSKPKAATA
jgi:flagellar M-ring protein FliF